jgi:two-component system OmpR family sensor kinase
MNKKLANGWARISLRTKLTALSVAIIGLLLAISSVGTMSLLATYMQRNTDTTLLASAEALSDELPDQISARVFTGQLVLPDLPSDYYIAYLDPQGGLIRGIFAGSNKNRIFPNLTNFKLPEVARIAGIPFEIDKAGIPSSDVGENNGWRIVAVPTTSYSGSLVIALPVANSHALIARYRDIGTLFGGLLLILSALAIWFTITSALRPLKEVERTAAAVASGKIDSRLVEQSSKTEVGRINTALNSMLESIQGALDSRGKALDQMRRFVSDASHELRTPLASVRGYAELYRMGALKDKSNLDDAMGRIEAEAIRMGGLVDSLLTLARLDEATDMKLVETDLVPIALDAAKDASVAEYKRKIVVTNFKGEPLDENHHLPAWVDAMAFRQVLTNLLANASRFSPHNGTVELVLGLQGHKMAIEVRDHGEGIPEQLRDKVFERFFRADNSRNRETGGSGLGLSIVKTILDRHKASIIALETPGGGTTMRITLS